MQAKNLKKQAAAKARSAALTPAQRSRESERKRPSMTGPKASRLTLAGSTPSKADNDGEAAKPQPVNAAVGHDDGDVASPNDLRLC